MERVTKRTIKGELYTDSLLKYYNYSDYQAVLRRLAHYEDLDEQGRLVILPAKTVYELTWDAGPNCNLVCPVSIDGEGQCDFCDHGELCIYERECKQEHIPLIGKTVFLSRPEAESALANKLGGGK